MGSLTLATLAVAGWALATWGLGGCAGQAGPGGPPGQAAPSGQAAPGAVPSWDGREEKQAREALARWDAALAASGGNPVFVPVGELTRQVGEWEGVVGANNKLALDTGHVKIAAGLPAAAPAKGVITWADGKTREIPLTSAEQALRKMIAGSRSDCGGCTQLEVTGAELSIMDIQTTRGAAKIPAWEYALRGTKVKILYPAAESGASVMVIAPPWDSTNDPAGLSIEGATISADGKRLTVNFIGAPGARDKPCGADYVARAIESTNAVVVLVAGIPHAADEACRAIGAMRTAEATLDTPLGDRAVLEVRQGLPVPLTRS